MYAGLLFFYFLMEMTVSRNSTVSSQTRWKDLARVTPAIKKTFFNQSYKENSVNSFW